MGVSSFKLIVWDESRDAAILRLQHALSEFHLLGIPSNRDFLQRLVRVPALQQGDVHTHFIEEYHDVLFAEVLVSVPVLGLVMAITVPAF